MPHPPHFQVAVVSDDTVQLRWLRPLEYKDDLSIVLERELAILDGVEDVIFRRYSATLTIAKHVKRASEVAQAVFDLFEAGNPVEYETRRTYGTDWKVLISPLDIVRFDA